MSNTTTTKTTKGETTIKRGRPTVEGSKRQAVMAMRQAKRDAGIEIKRGRPKMVKDETTEVVAKAPKAKQSKADKQAQLAKTETVVKVPTEGKQLVARNITKDIAVLTLEDIIGETGTLVVPDAQ
jgi:hypothetical protein